LKEEY